MIKSFLSVLAVLLLTVSPVYAAEVDDTGDSAAAEDTSEVVKEVVVEENMEERLALSKEMHKIWPIRQKMERAMDVVGERVKESERTKFKAAMRRSINYDELEKASIEAMADIFTKAELEKMIEFYGSKEGRSVSYKTSDYEKVLQPFMREVMDKALIRMKLGSE